MEQFPLISVIIPVYNAKKYLPQTLESVLSQSLKNIEIICVDDGSEDGSAQLLEDYARRDGRVRVLRQKNLHAGVARNNGLAVARGEYVHFLDADDYVLDYAYEALYHKMVKYDLDVVKFPSIPYDEQRQEAVEIPAYTLSFLQAGDFNRLLEPTAGSPILRVNVAPWNGLYRRDFLVEHGLEFNDLFCVNDRSFFCAVITNARRMMLARDRLVVHRVNREGALEHLRAQHVDCQFRSLEMIGARLAADGIDSRIQAAVMEREFTDLMVWFERFCRDPERGEEIARKTEGFVRSFQSPYQGRLKQLYQERLWRMAGEPREEKIPEGITRWTAPCPAPKVSVVVPIYNVEDYLNEALESLRRQTLKEMEFLCVNDGSTDGSLAIIREYAALDKRFVLLDGPNGGYGKAMNRGIDAARGEYLGILEPDDFVPEHMYRTLYRTAKKNKLDLVKANFNEFVVRPNGFLRKKVIRLASNSSYYGRVICPREERQVFRFAMNTWSGIYNLNFLNRWHIRHNETPGASYQDNGFWFKTFCRAERIWFVNQAFYNYRKDNPGASMTNRKKVYCATEEYRLIWEWLSGDPELEETFRNQFYEKKFRSYLVTYRRIDRELHREYLHHIRDEFQPVMEAGYLEEELFTAQDWKKLNEILADPDAYCDHMQVSVILPVYNAEQYLAQCLDSLLADQSINKELICVDDGSTDGSLEILRAYAAKDDRVRVFTKPNGGAGSARNLGMQYARGEYLSFLDADDFFEPDMFERTYYQAHTLGTDITVFRCDQYLEVEDKFTTARYTIKDKLLPLEQPFAGTEITPNLFGAFMGWAWDKLFRAEFVREHGLQFQELRTTNDMLFVFSAVVLAERISTLNNVLAHHRRAGGSLSVTREESWGCFYQALLALRQNLRDWGLYEQLEQDFINYSLHFSLWQLETLRGGAYHQLYRRLTEQWWAELGILAHDAYYFYDLAEYRKMQEMLETGSEEFFLQELDKTREELNRARSEFNRLNNEKRRQKERSAALDREIQALRKKNRAIKTSQTYRLGRVLTWPVRKLKSLLKGK